MPRSPAVRNRITKEAQNGNSNGTKTQKARKGKSVGVTYDEDVLNDICAIFEGTNLANGVRSQVSQLIGLGTTMGDNKGVTDSKQYKSLAKLINLKVN